MRRGGECAVRAHARGLLFDPALQRALREAAESALEPVETPVTLVVDILFPAGREAGIL